MAPGQAELKYVDVRVTRPTALPAGAAPGFEEPAPGAEFVAEKAEVALTLDAKLPAAVPQGPQEPDQEPARGALRPGRHQGDGDPVPDAAAAADDAARDALPLSADAADAAPAAAAAQPRRRRPPQPPRRPRRRGARGIPMWLAVMVGVLWPADRRVHRRAVARSRAARQEGRRPRRSGRRGRRRQGGRRRRRRPRPTTCPRSGARCARIASSPGA